MLNIPNKRLLVITSRADMTRRMRSPRDAIYTRSMVVKARHRRARHSHVQYDHLDGIHRYSRQVIRLLFIPGESQQRIMVRVFVNDGRVLEVTKIKHAHRTVGAHRGEHVAAAARATERDIVYFFVVRDQLGLDVAGDLGAAEYLTGLEAPDRACGVDGGGADQVRVDLVPVE